MAALRVLCVTLPALRGVLGTTESPVVLRQLLLFPNYAPATLRKWACGCGSFASEAQHLQSIIVEASVAAFNAPVPNGVTSLDLFTGKLLGTTQQRFYCR